MSRARRTVKRCASAGAGNASIEASYQTHWVSPKLSEKKRERLAQKINRAPELVVIQPLNDDWTCHRCGGSGSLLMMETPRPACLRCVGLDDLGYPTTMSGLRRRNIETTESTLLAKAHDGFFLCMCGV